MDHQWAAKGMNVRKQEKQREIKHKMALWKRKENWRNVPGVEKSLGITGCGGWSNGMVVRS
jgi:hypothetical protein